MKTKIEFDNIRWAPYSKYGYASGRLTTIAFTDKKECDEWVENANNSYPGCTQYKTLPYITGEDVEKCQILN